MSQLGLIAESSEPSSREEITPPPVCGICLDECAASGDGVSLLGCRHVFHLDCLLQQLSTSIPPAGRLHLNLWDCPLCRTPLEPQAGLAEDVHRIQQLRARLRQIAEQEFARDPEPPRATGPSPSGEALIGYYAFYICGSCGSPYVGGKLNCILDMERQERALRADVGAAGDENGPGEPLPEPKEAFRCVQCATQLVQCNDPDSHRPFHLNKCRYCCSAAVWFCYGTTSFCASCHNDAGRLRNLTPEQLPPCAGPADCPLGIAHPPHGHEFSIGCTVCQALHEITSPLAIQKLKKEQQILLRKERLRDQVLTMLLGVWAALFCFFVHQSFEPFVSGLRSFLAFFFSLCEFVLLFAPFFLLYPLFLTAVNAPRPQVRLVMFFLGLAVLMWVCIPLQLILSTVPGSQALLPSLPWITPHFGIVQLAYLIRDTAILMGRFGAPIFGISYILYLLVIKPRYEPRFLANIALVFALSFSFELFSYIRYSAGYSYFLSVLLPIIYLELLAILVYSLYSLVLLTFHQLRPQYELWAYTVYINCKDVLISLGYLAIFTLIVEGGVYRFGLPTIFDLNPQSVQTVLYFAGRLLDWTLAISGIVAAHVRQLPRLQRRMTFFLLSAVIMVFEVTDISSRHDLYTIDRFLTLLKSSFAPLFTMEAAV